MVATIRTLALIAILLASTAAAQTVRVKLAGRGVVPVLMEDYVGWVLAGEAGGMKSDEALKAMAITVRSYARANRGRHASQGFDYCETTHCQDARAQAVTERLRTAAWETEGVTLWYQGRPALVFYTGHCGGRTAAAGEIWPRAARPYLKSMEDSYCLSAGRNAWSAKVAWSDLATALGLTEIHALEMARRTASGRAWKLQSDVGLIDAERLHLKVGRLKGWNLMRSRNYDVRSNESQAIFDGSGTGHGVGLCQIGAEQRGEAGQKVAEILEAYFPGTRAGVSAQEIPWRKGNSERVELWLSGPATEQQVVPMAERALAAAERKTSLTVQKRPVVKVYPSVSVFRDATGEAGTVAAITRGRVVHLQPLMDSLEQTLVHEMLHVVFGLNAKRPLPLWFEEGLADHLGDGRSHPAERARVEKMIRAQGLSAVLAMVTTGVRP